MKTSNYTRSVERLAELAPTIVYVIKRPTALYSKTARYDFLVGSNNGLINVNKEVASIVKATVSKIVGKENVMTKKSDTTFLTRVGYELSVSLGHVVECRII